MEKYIKYKAHTEDDFARLLVKAFKAQGIYDSQKHDTIILAIAPLFVRLEQARDAIADYGVLVTEITREGNERYVRNPACDIESAYVDRIRKALHDVGMYIEAKPDKTNPEDDIVADHKSDSLSELGHLIGGIGKRSYRKPDA